MNVTNEPALGIDRENSDMVFPVARIARPAIRNAHGAMEPIANTTSVIARKMPSTGARLASVEEIVSNRVSAPPASAVWGGPACSSIVAIAAVLAGVVGVCGAPGARCASRPSQGRPSLSRAMIFSGVWARRPGQATVVHTK